jgi:HK97 family phage prohead protease
MTTDLLEVRTFSSGSLELRAAEEGSDSIATVTGYAMRYGEPSLPLPFIERFEPGAFTRSLKSRNDIRLYINHDDTKVLASRRSGTLRLEDRAEGLWIEADLPDTTDGRDIRVLMGRGDVHEQSIGFSAVRDSWSGDRSSRTVREAKLYDSSIVTGIAAYPSTSASIRNLTLIAYRTHTDVDALADAFSALESGEMSDDQAAVLLEAVDRSRPAREIEPEPVDVPDLSDVLALKSYLLKKAAQ